MEQAQKVGIDLFLLVLCQIYQHQIAKSCLSDFKGMPLQKAKVRQAVVKRLLMSTSQYKYQQIKANTHGVPDRNRFVQLTSNEYDYSSSFPSTYTATSTQAQSLFKASLRTEM